MIISFGGTTCRYQRQRSAAVIWHDRNKLMIFYQSLLDNQFHVIAMNHLKTISIFGLFLGAQLLTSLRAEVRSQASLSPPSLRVLSPIVFSSSSTSWKTFKLGINATNIPKGSKIHLRCDGVKPLAWKYPENIVVSWLLRHVFTFSQQSPPTIPSQFSQHVLSPRAT